MNRIHSDIRRYYTDKILRHGVSPQGVDWKDESSQHLRFEQLLRLIDVPRRFSINDLGCGYGNLYEFLGRRGYADFDYTGYDLSEEMIRHAGSLYESGNSRFVRISGAAEMGRADYTVASGIFNVRIDHDDDAWLGYILATLAEMNRASQRGFAFNILTSYSDREYMRQDLYYADPCYFFDYCKRNFAKNVALLHDYGLYEFTLIVRKE